MGSYSSVHQNTHYLIEMTQQLYGFPWIPTLFYKEIDHRVLYRVTGGSLKSKEFFDLTIIPKEGLTVTHIVETALHMDRY